MTQNGKNNDEISLKILDTAKQLFKNDGVEQVSMYRIAQMAGIGQGTLYRRYANKSKLCFAIMEHKFAKFTDDVDKYLANSDEQCGVDRISTLVRMMIDFVYEDLEWIKAVTHSERLEDAKENCFETSPFQYFVNKMIEIFEQAAAKGERTNGDPKLISYMIISSFSPMLLLHLAELGYSPAQITEEYCKSFIRPLFA